MWDTEEENEGIKKTKERKRKKTGKRKHKKKVRGRE